MGLLVLLYTAVMWSVIILAPHALIAIFSSDATLMDDAVKALNIYSAAFIFMDLQYIGQTTFKSLNKKKRAIFFSLLRKVLIVVPLTYILRKEIGVAQLVKQFPQRSARMRSLVFKHPSLCQFAICLHFVDLVLSGTNHVLVQLTDCFLYKI